MYTALTKIVEAGLCGDTQKVERYTQVLAKSLNEPDPQPWTDERRARLSKGILNMIEIHYGRMIPNHATLDDAIKELPHKYQSADFNLYLHATFAFFKGFKAPQLAILDTREMPDGLSLVGLFDIKDSGYLDSDFCSSHYIFWLTNKGLRSLKEIKFADLL